MLYFTHEVFRRLANQNQGHVHVMLEFMKQYKDLDTFRAVSVV